MAETDQAQDENLEAVRRLEESFIEAEGTLAFVRYDHVAASPVAPYPGARRFEGLRSRIRWLFHPDYSPTRVGAAVEAASWFLLVLLMGYLTFAR